MVDSTRVMMHVRGDAMKPNLMRILGVLHALIEAMLVGELVNPDGSDRLAIPDIWSDSPIWGVGDDEREREAVLGD